VIGDIMGSLDAENDGILHDVVNDSAYSYMLWRLSCRGRTTTYGAATHAEGFVWIDVGTRLRPQDDTNCMACVARRA
jgi:hypothetical protein